MNKYDNIFRPNIKLPDNKPEDDTELELIDQLIFEAFGIIPPGYTKLSCPNNYLEN